jgi:DnaJ-class molecular chaperone
MATNTSTASQAASPLAGMESVAGEEDPGASCDVAREEAGRPMAPGDQAPAGTPGTGEGVCPRCGGSGRIGETECPDCAGTGKVIEGIGGA